MKATPSFGPARRLAAAVLISIGLSAMAQAADGPAKGPPAREAAREIRWEELMPKDWNPYAQMRDQGGADVVDGSVRAMQQMREMREIWDKAPTNPALDGRAVKLPGYVVPIEETREGLKEFLLVPYFGACIHSPPPPANQIVHVVSPRPVKGFSTMDTVWVSGTLSLARQESAMGVSGYRLAATAVVRYAPPARR